MNIINFLLVKSFIYPNSFPPSEYYFSKRLPTIVGSKDTLVAIGILDGLGKVFKVARICNDVSGELEGMGKGFK